MRIRGLFVSALLVLPTTLLAQDTPFRAGQWGAQFTGGFSLASIGVLKFRSPSSATVLDFRIGGSHFEAFTQDTLADIRSQASIDLRLGRRRYRPIAGDVVALHSLGVLAGFDHFVQASPFGGRFTSHGWQLGPYADVGAVYLVSPHLGIGVTGTASIFYSRTSSESTSGLKSKSWQLGGATAMTFSATLFF